jgi:Sigma-70, region 4
VVRHEAIAIRRARTESVAGEDIDLDEFVPSGERSVEEQIASSERVRRSAEALRALKPDEAQALMMKAHGLSYEEIGERNGWTYTKVNRAITEGRRRFMAVFEGIESGEECERFAPTVEALALGSATAAQLLSIRPHLRHCVACRAAVRDLHLSRIQRALVWPGFVLAASTPSIEEHLRALAEHAPAAPTIDERLRMIVEPGGLPDPGVVPDPTTVVPAPDPLPVDGLLEMPVGRLGHLKQQVSSLFHRANTSDLATGVQMVATSGGGRVATVAAVLGVCLSSASVVTVCVVTGVVSDPLGLLRDDRPRVVAKPHVTHRTPSHTFARAAATPAPTPAATPALRPRTTPRHRQVAAAKPTAAAANPSQGTTPTSHENAPISPAPASTTGQESFSPEVPQTPAAPAPAPATGGEEFGP